MSKAASRPPSQPPARSLRAALAATSRWRGCGCGVTLSAFVSHKHTFNTRVGTGFKDVCLSVCMWMHMRIKLLRTLTFVSMRLGMIQSIILVSDNLIRNTCLSVVLPAPSASITLCISLNFSISLAPFLQSYIYIYI